MTTVTIDDALAETARRWEREASGRAEMQAMLDGPRHPRAESDVRMRLKYDIPSLSHLTREEREAEAERVIAAMAPDVREKMEREGLL